MQGNVEYVERTVSQRGVTFIRLWYIDVQGITKGIAFPASDLRRVLEDGVGIDGSALQSSARLSEIDVIARPEVDGFQILPWRPDVSVARMFATLELPDGTPFDADPRRVLRSMVDKAAARGFHMQVGAELEFHIFKGLPEGGAIPEPVEAGAYYDLTPFDIATDFRRVTLEFLSHLGVPVKAAYHEAGPSQQELVLRQSDPLTTGDDLLTCRMAVKQAAYNLGGYASFMPKPLANEPGSGLHVHVSLSDDQERNLFAPDDERAAIPLSPVGQQFMAGVLRHAPEMTLITNQWINSYTRLHGGHEAPNAVTWSRRHPNPLVRVPEIRPNHPDAARIELRSPDSGANPYLVFALMLAAGLRGIEQGYELPPETAEAEPGSQLLPASLSEAIPRFEQSELVQETLGPRVIEWLVSNKRRELHAYRRTVSEFERATYLPLL